MRHGPTEPKHYSKLVHFWSADLSLESGQVHCSCSLWLFAVVVRCSCSLWVFDVRVCQQVAPSGSGTIFILKVFARMHESQFSERLKKEVVKNEVPTQRHIQPQDFTLASHHLLTCSGTHWRSRLRVRLGAHRAKLKSVLFLPFPGRLSH